MKRKDKPAFEFNFDEMLEIIFQDRVRYSSLHSAAVNHELQTPLVIIRGLAESLLRNQIKDPQAHLREIANEADRLLKVLDAMVFIPPPEPFQMQNISLRSIIEQVIIFFEKTCLEKGISLQIDVAEHLRVEAEPSRLKSILSALIQNAIESFEDKPKTETKNITIHAQDAADGLHLSISDTGSGISNEIQKKIVEEIFERRNILPIKLGLGLAFAKKLANDLNIKLGFVSEKFRGTNFTLTFKK